MDIDIEQMRQLAEILENSSLTEIEIEERDFKLKLKKDRSTSSAYLQEKKEAPPSAGLTDSNERLESRPDNAAGNEMEGKGRERSVEREPTTAGTEEKNSNEISITSPIVGTFYRSASPEDPPYVEVGDSVREGETVCIVEAMKVMNEVKANASGTIIEICVEDGDPVEFGQDLLTVKMDGSGDENELQ